MPIDRSRYPHDWEFIAFCVKARADWVCEVCRKQCRRPGEKFDTHKRTLTVAHINHTPEDCDENNLVAACAPCHLNYDRPMKALRRIVKQRLEGAK
jgi:hypothetical protein